MSLADLLNHCHGRIFYGEIYVDTFGPTAWPCEVDLPKLVECGEGQLVAVGPGGKRAVFGNDTWVDLAE